MATLFYQYVPLPDNKPLTKENISYVAKEGIRLKSGQLVLNLSLFDEEAQKYIHLANILLSKDTSDV